MKKYIIILILSGLTACSQVTTVKDYDSDKISYDEAKAMINSGGVEYTEDTVILAERDDVYVTNVKTSPSISFNKDYVVKQDKWAVVIYNSSEIDHCVGIIWKLMDYKYITNYPGSVYVKGGSQLIVGEMIQVVWEIDGVKFTPPGSGYVHALLVEEVPNDGDNIDDMDKCIHFEDEKDIVVK